MSRARTRSSGRQRDRGSLLIIIMSAPPAPAYASGMDAQEDGAGPAISR